MLGFMAFSPTYSLTYLALREYDRALGQAAWEVYFDFA
jgi:hypothetical protein